MNTAIMCLAVSSVCIVSAASALAECVEYQIVDHGDSVEAVCVGKPLTVEEQKVRLDEERREQQRLQNQIKVEQQKERDRAVEEQRAQERKAQEQRALEQKNLDAGRAASKNPSRNPSRQENAVQRSLGNKQPTFP